MRFLKRRELVVSYCLTVLLTTSLKVWGEDAYPRLTIASAPQLLGKDAVYAGTSALPKKK